MKSDYIHVNWSEMLSLSDIIDCNKLKLCQFSSVCKS